MSERCSQAHLRRLKRARGRRRGRRLSPLEPAPRHPRALAATWADFFAPPNNSLPHPGRFPPAHSPSWWLRRNGRTAQRAQAVKGHARPPPPLETIPKFPLPLSYVRASHSPELRARFARRNPLQMYWLLTQPPALSLANR